MKGGSPDLAMSDLPLHGEWCAKCFLCLVSDLQFIFLVFYIDAAVMQYQNLRIHEVLKAPCTKNPSPDHYPTGDSGSALGDINYSGGRG